MLSKAVRILIVDDDRSLRELLAIVLQKEGYEVEGAESGLAALKRLKEGRFNLVISDIKMPDISGIELLRRIRNQWADLPVLMLTAYASANDAVEAMKLHAEDYLVKPFKNDELKMVVRKVLRQKVLEQENVELKEKLQDRERFENIVGTHAQMLKIFDLIDTIAQTDSTVLISGESGTGKELIARAIHSKSRRAANPFVSINCGALPENLLESELFGHQRGSFTDAYQEKIGLVEVADRGTLFLDEIAEMSQNMQVKLLRAIQERVIRRVGGNEEIKVDVRLIAATNKNMASAIQDGSFRKDLFYRLNVISIEVPPLSQRREDIPILMNHFLNRFNASMNKAIRGFASEVVERFLHYPWPGNVRELENFVERAVALEKNDTIGLHALPPELLESAGGPVRGAAEEWRGLLSHNDLNYSEYIDSVSKKILNAALEIHGGNLKKTADTLKLNYRSLRYLIEKFNLRVKG